MLQHPRRMLGILEVQAVNNFMPLSVVVAHRPDELRKIR
jgi:hypothetical protein